MSETIRVRFGAFEVDAERRELRKRGIRISLENQPFEVLEALLENPGEVVSRGELQRRIWADGTFVDFEKSLTKAVNKLRGALGDSASTPRYVETLTKHGYRFIAPVEVIDRRPLPPEARQPESGADVKSPEPPVGPTAWFRRPFSAFAAAAALLVLGGVLSIAVRYRSIPAFQSVPRIDAMAVLPIENLTSDPERDYFADGLTDELIAHLGRIQSVRVISRTSAMRYKGAKKALPEIARELRVDGIIEGSVQHLPDRLRINVRLMHAPTDRQLWTGTFEGRLEDATTLQRRITLAIAHEIGAWQTAEDTARLFGRRQKDPIAYDAYLRGRHLWNQRADGAIERAKPYFQQALREDAGFALAYSGLADCYTIGWTAKEDYGLAEAYARKAIALEPDLAEAHVSLGMAQLCRYQFPEAERELKRGIELNANYVTARQFHAIYLLTMGRLAEALAANDLALELDPFSLPVNNFRGIILTNMRQYDRAMEQQRAAVALAPETVGVYSNLARLYWLQGRAAEALAIERRMASLARSETWERAQAEAEAVLSREGFSAACRRSSLIKTQLFGPSNPFGVFETPFQFAYLQDRENVLGWLERLHDKKGYGAVMMLKTAPEFDFLRSDPRFKELLRRTGLPD